MTDRRCLTEVEVAAKLGRDRAWFCRNKKRLIRKEGFPPMLPVVRRWDEAAIDAWLNRQMPAALHQFVPAETSTDLEADEKELVERAVGIAAEQGRPH